MPTEEDRKEVAESRHYLVDAGTVSVDPCSKDGIREVVMCRDCVHYRPENEQRQTPPRCTGAFAFVKPDPDGFCAWGRKDER